MAQKNYGLPAADPNSTDTEMSPAFLEDEINFRKAQIKKQSNNQLKSAVKKISGADGAELDRPISGLAERMLGKAGEKKTATAPEIGKQTKIADENAQAKILSAQKSKLSQANGNQGDQIPNDVEKETQQLTDQLTQKKTKWFLIAFVPTAIWLVLWSLILGFLLFLVISVYRCSQEKGIVGTAWTTVTGGFTGLLEESFSGKCIPDNGGQQKDEKPTTPTESNGSVAGNGTAKADESSD